MSTSTHEARLAALRQELEQQSLDGFIIPISDEHMSEYVGEYAQRLAWLTGFDGSAGTAVVLRDRAAVFVDGRYTLQLQSQVDSRLYAFENVPATSPAQWLSHHAPPNARIGFDPWLHGTGWVATMTKAIQPRGATLVAVARNPVDAVWTDRPAPSSAPAVPHSLAYAGEPSILKRATLAQWLIEHGLDAVVISALDSVAWLLNIRGQDVARTPVTLAFTIVHSDTTADLFIAPEKVSPALADHLGDAVRIKPYADFPTSLKALAGRRVAVDPERNVAAIAMMLDEAGATGATGATKVINKSDPCVLPKALKNAIEQAGHHAAQVRDGTAMARFLCWLEQAGPTGTVTEISAAEQLHAFRRGNATLYDLSFDTISGAGPDGAIVHYRVTPETDRQLAPDSVYLVDSGGQYPDGTTDITRTVWIGPGTPPTEIKDRFTRVLKGHIALSLAVFPQGTTGSQLDSLARQFLWAAGLDYAHGTGHGIGSFLCVHEGPQRIAKTADKQALLPGMILSNEPGYYQTGAYGIRIENLMLVEERDIAGAQGPFLGFKTLTLVPIDRSLVMPELLTSPERDWWNNYHHHVRHILAPLLAGQELIWLEAACAAI